MQSPLMGIFRVLQMAQDLLGIDVNSLENQPLMSKKKLKILCKQKIFYIFAKRKTLKN
jgi:hypothetical protein